MRPRLLLAWGEVCLGATGRRLRALQRRRPAEQIAQALSSLAVPQVHGQNSVGMVQAAKAPEPCRCTSPERGIACSDCLCLGARQLLGRQNQGASLSSEAPGCASANASSGAGAGPVFTRSTEELHVGVECFGRLPVSCITAFRGWSFLTWQRARQAALMRGFWKRRRVVDVARGFARFRQA